MWPARLAARPPSHRIAGCSIDPGHPPPRTALCRHREQMLPCLYAVGGGVGTEADVRAGIVVQVRVALMRLEKRGRSGGRSWPLERW